MSPARYHQLIESLHNDVHTSPHEHLRAILASKVSIMSTMLRHVRPACYHVPESSYSTTLALSMVAKAKSLDVRGHTIFKMSESVRARGS